MLGNRRRVPDAEEMSLGGASCGGKSGGKGSLATGRRDPEKHCGDWSRLPKAKKTFRDGTLICEDFNNSIDWD